MIRRHRTTRWSALALAAALAIAACGGDDDNSDSGGPGNLDVATGGRLFATADEETAKLGSDAEPGQFPRTVVHALGETVIESAPQRVVVLDTGELDDVISLGLVPVGVAYTDGSPSAPAYLPDEVEGIATVGTTSELNLEAIAALQPDLILGSQLRAEDLYTQLSTIAPTVFSIRPGFPWKENLLLVSEALGREDAAVDLLNEYQQRADEVAAAIEGDPVVSILRFRPSEIRLYGNASFIGVVLQDIGLPRPENQDIHELATVVTAETIEEADADWLFYSSYGSPDSTDEAVTVDSPLWNSLSAVQADRAVRVDDELWFLALGPSGATALLDEIETFMTS